MKSFLFINYFTSLVSALQGTETLKASQYVVDNEPWDIEELWDLASGDPKMFFNRMTYLGYEWRMAESKPQPLVASVRLPFINMSVGFVSQHKDISAYHHKFRIKQPNGKNKSFSIRYSDMRHHGGDLPNMIEGFDTKHLTISKKGKKAQAVRRAVWFDDHFDHEMPDGNGNVYVYSKHQEIRGKSPLALQNFALMFVKHLAESPIEEVQDLPSEWNDYGVYPAGAECVVCMDAEPNVVTFSTQTEEDNKGQQVKIPCGHLSMCEHCAVKVSDCPQCRAEIHSRFKVKLREGDAPSDSKKNELGGNGFTSELIRS